MSARTPAKHEKRGKGYDTIIESRRGAQKYILPTSHQILFWVLESNNNFPCHPTEHVTCMCPCNVGHRSKIDSL